MDTWKRESPSIFEYRPFPKVTGEDPQAHAFNLAEAEAPPLVTENFESAKENSEPHEKGDDGLKQASTTRDVTSPPATSAKRASSIGWRTVAIFGIISFTVGLGLSAVLFSKSGWDLQALHPVSESIAASLTKLVSAETSPVTGSVPDDATSQTANQLQSIGAELSYLRQDIRALTSLRQDIKSLSDEIAQIRKAQENLIRAEAESLRKPGRPPSPPVDSRARPTPQPPARPFFR